MPKKEGEMKGERGRERERSSMRSAKWQYKGALIWQSKRVCSQSTQKENISEEILIGEEEKK